MAHILNLSTLLVMRLSTYNGPFIIWNSFIIFLSNKFNPPYIMPHIVFKMHLSELFGCDFYQLSPTHMECHEDFFKSEANFLIWANVAFLKIKSLTWFLIALQHFLIIIEEVLCAYLYKSAHIIKVLSLLNHANVKTTLIYMEIHFFIFVSIFSKTCPKIVHNYVNMGRFTHICFVNMFYKN